MVEEIKLSAILSILNNYLDRFTADLTPEQMSILHDELSGLKESVDSAKSSSDIDIASKKFYESITNFKHLEFLTDLDKNKLRGGSLPGSQEDIKIKIINYCVVLQERIEDIQNGNIRR